MISKEKFLGLLDKHIDQQGLALDLGKELIKPWLEEQKAKVVAGEIDLIKGTQLDNEALVKVIDALLAKLG